MILPADVCRLLDSMSHFLLSNYESFQWLQLGPFIHSREINKYKNCRCYTSIIFPEFPCDGRGPDFCLRKSLEYGTAHLQIGKTHTVPNVELKRAVIQAMSTYSEVVEKHLKEKRLSWVREDEKTQKSDSRKKRLQNDETQARLDSELTVTKPTEVKKPIMKKKKKRAKTHFRKSQKPSRL